MPAHSEHQKIPVLRNSEGVGHFRRERVNQRALVYVLWIPLTLNFLILYGNLATFGESGLIEAQSERAYNACDIQLKILNICFRDAGMQFAENHHRIQNFPTKAPCLHSPLAVISTASSIFHHCFDSLLSFIIFILLF